MSEATKEDWNEDYDWDGEGYYLCSATCPRCGSNEVQTDSNDRRMQSRFECQECEHTGDWW